MSSKSGLLLATPRCPCQFSGMTKPNFYAGHGLDRLAHYRRDEGWLAGRLTQPQTRLLPVWHGQSLVDPAEPGLIALTVARAAALVPRAREVVWLGEHRGAVHFALDLSHLPDPSVDPWHADHLDADSINAVFQDLRTVGPLMDKADSALLAYARGMTHWHGRHQFCGVCGHRTISAEAGHTRKCTNHDCGTTHFPRTDPAVIVLIVDKGRDDEQRCLLARNRNWRHMPGMRSTLAGFVEPGESLEDTVRREMLEEVGVRIGRMAYHSSQPWPFPASIMIGFYAVAENTDLTLEDDEIEVADWYTRRQLLDSPEDETFRLPRKDSIARRLIEEWMRGEVEI